MIKVANIFTPFVILSLLFVFFSPMHDFYIVEGVNQFYGFVEFA